LELLPVLVWDMIEILPPSGKYKYDTRTILSMKCYIDNSVHLRSCIRNVNVVSHSSSIGLLVKQSSFLLLAPSLQFPTFSSWRKFTFLWPRAKPCSLFLASFWLLCIEITPKRLALSDRGKGSEALLWRCWRDLLWRWFCSANSLAGRPATWLGRPTTTWWVTASAKSLELPHGPINSPILVEIRTHTTFWRFQLPSSHS
jgi:hypothetical protein